MERKIVRGKTIEEQIASIDHALVSLRRRSGGMIVGVVPPIPIMIHCLAPGAEGDVAKVMLPFAAKIKSIYVYIGSKEVDEINFVLSYKLGGNEVTTRGAIKDLFQKVEVEYDVAEGGIISISVREVEKVKDILVSFLAYPEMQYYERDMMIEEQLKRIVKAREEEEQS